MPESEFHSIYHYLLYADRLRPWLRTAPGQPEPLD
jgi:hypothetical protein